MLFYVILYAWPKRGGVGGLNWKGVWTVEVGKRYSCVTLAKGAVSAGADKVGIFSLVGGLCRRRRLSIACACRDGGGVRLRREAAHHPLCSITLLGLSLMSQWLEERLLFLVGSWVGLEDHGSCCFF